MIQTMAIEQFWNWFHANNDRLIDKPPLHVVNVIAEEIEKVDPGISIEVSNVAGDGTRELIFTSNGDESRFGLIARIVEQCPDIDRWSVSSLKPPRGFEFEVGGIDALDISHWKFIPLKSSTDFSEIALRIELPECERVLLDDVTLCRIIEEGVGEVLYSLCEHIELSSTDTPEALPISELAETLHIWAITRGPSSIRLFLPALEY